jgi:hypothetical protein
MPHFNGIFLHFLNSPAVSVAVVSLVSGAVGEFEKNRDRASAFIGIHRDCNQGGASPAPTVHDFALQHSSG